MYGFKTLFSFSDQLYLKTIVDTLGLESGLLIELILLIDERKNLQTFDQKQLKIK